MLFTPNYNLGKPSGAVGGDFVDITVLDTNMDTIDTQIKNRANDIAVLQAAPSFITGYVRLLKNAAQSILSGAADVAVTWDTEQEDASGFHAVNSGQIIVPAGKAGVYVIHSKIYWAGNAVNFRQASIKNNGATLTEDTVAGIAGAHTTRQLLTCVQRLAVGDIVTIEVNQTSGGALNTTGTAAADFPFVELIRVSG